MRWGTKQQFALGKAWATVKSHPVFVGLSPFSGMKSCTQEPGWGATEGATHGVVITDTHKANILEEIKRTHPDLDENKVTCAQFRAFVAFI